MISFENDYYSAKIDDVGNFEVKSINGEPIINALNYHATAGVTASIVKAIPAGATQVVVEESHMNNLSIGDSIEIHTGAINNSYMSSFTIVDIVDNTVYLSNQFSGSWENAEYNARTIVKKTSQIKSLENISVYETVEDKDKTVIIEGETPFSEVKIIISFYKDSHKIEFETEVNYTSNVNIFNEKLEVVFADRPTEIYKRNRKVDKKVQQSHYWVDKQGAKFGDGTKSAYIYHAPKVSSLEVFSDERKLVVNLDDMRDHRYRFVKPAQGDRVFIDRHAAEFKSGDVRVNSFNLLVGKEINVPRFMMNPEGYLATYIWTEHADRAYMDSQRATVFGSEDIEHIDDAVGGFAKHGIPMTKSVFYDAQAYDFIAVINHPDSPEFINFLKQLHSNGFDICLHSGGYRTSLRPVNEVMMPHMEQEFGSNVWIDHMADYNREDISADGMTPPEDLGLSLEQSAYVKDLWENHGVKYFWTYSSEDNRLANSIDLLRPNEPSARTPLYWKHPTVTYDFYTWATTRNASHSLSASWWDSLLSINNLNKLVDDWGVSINHGYFAYKPSSGIMQTIDGKLQLHPTFDNVLKRMATYKENKKINVTTVNEIMDYWLAIEDIEINYLDSEITLKNNSGRDIKGLSMAVSNDDEVEIIVDETTPNQTIVDGNIIFWFDIGEGQTASIKIETKKDDEDELTNAQKRLKMSYFLRDSLAVGTNRETLYQA